MPFQRRDDKHLNPLFPEAECHQLKQERLARAAHAHDRHIRVGIFPAVEDIHNADRAVMLVDAQHNARLVADFKTGKGECRRDSGSQGITPCLPFYVRVHAQKRQGGKETFPMFVVRTLAEEILRNA